MEKAKIEEIVEKKKHEAFKALTEDNIKQLCDKNGNVDLVSVTALAIDISTKVLTEVLSELL